ncbi:MAG: glycoside hydrolase family 1 protein [Candidatus Tagabacteria bacterium CG10_big_fil_rev_8_21_14_0_10_40_13]|uniref:Glycoside hydrolase family 1 protein n=1 Tax=Candidatus Tagabacteria bacterium CG10_big_fil_rev_8_21_14_0_10_40_13 TaxID=1975022 RepID=A0A2M8L8X0_9BACT|nr:MAG: glycoside hydrolase family 1 protein [Candidatus Tagabacteria bacterium CG10_big_fil_rev_8_21_14_0_10_40_13]
MEYRFPKDFLWGAATSSYQVEGNNYNDWVEWEHANSARLAAEAAKRHANAHMRIPEYILNNYPNPLQPENYISGRVCDHYNRFKEDFDIAKQIGHNAHRFSIEWSRVEPEEGKFDEKEIEHYQQVIAALCERGLEPFVTLWHWTVPIWFRDKGGWLNKDAPKYFERYVTIISRSLNYRHIKFWITINEPNVFASNSFLKGVWPPRYKNIFKYFKVLKNLAKAHKKSYEIIKKENPTAQVGISKNNIYFENIPFADYFWNKYFLNKIKSQQDFIGLNYYFHSRLFGNRNEDVTDMGWEIYPEGIYYVLRGLKKYNLPIYVTENGLADIKDEKRGKFIKDHLKWIHKVISESVDVRGYLYWSLLDNFEWDKGFWPRFGLVEIDYETLERKIRPSAYEYAKICKSNILEI